MGVFNLKSVKKLEDNYILYLKMVEQTVRNNFNY